MHKRLLSHRRDEILQWQSQSLRQARIGERRVRIFRDDDFAAHALLIRLMMMMLSHKMAISRLYSYSTLKYARNSKSNKCAYVVQRNNRLGRQMQLFRSVMERPKFGSRLGNNGHTELPRNHQNLAHQTTRRTTCWLTLYNPTTLHK